MANAPYPDRHLELVPSRALTAAETANVGEALPLPRGIDVLTAELIFTYGSGGTDLTVWVQTSFDGGATWVDIMSWNVTTSDASAISSVRQNTAVAANYTPTDGTLPDNTIKDGLLGDRIRCKWTSTGTYADSTTFQVVAVPN